MKRRVLLILLFAIISLGMYSCKSAQDCPAYSSVDNTEVEIEA